MFYKKIDHLIIPDNFELEPNKGINYVSYGYHNPVYKMGVKISYYKIKDDNVLIGLKNWLQTYYKCRANTVLISEIEGKGFLKPHCDDGIKTCLNIYYQVDNDVTTFYLDKAQNSGSTFVSRNDPNRKTSGMMYDDLSQLEEQGSFVANNKDAYFLDVSSIHSVMKPSINTRVFLTFEWVKDDIETILNSSN